MKCQGKKSHMAWEEMTYDWAINNALACAVAMRVFGGPLSVCSGGCSTSHSYGHPKCLGEVALVHAHSSTCCSLLLLLLPE